MELVVALIRIFKLTYTWCRRRHPRDHEAISCVCQFLIVRRRRGTNFGLADEIADGRRSSIAVSDIAGACLTGLLGNRVSDINIGRIKSQCKEVRPFMSRISIVSASAILLFALCLPADAQQTYRLPDLRTLKHLTTGSSDHAADITGKETTMDFYSASGGEIYTVYSYRGKIVAFSTHLNTDIQNTYHIFMDHTGSGNFQEINRGVPWSIPGWAR